LGRVVLFGGARQDAPSGPLIILADTWELDGSQWTQRTPATSPPARQGTAMAYDSARGHVVLFGGDDGQGLNMSDTWEWDGTDWTERHPAHAPPARHQHSLAFDSARGRIVLFGGVSSTPGIRLADTWEWDGTDWQQIQP